MGREGRQDCDRDGTAAVVSAFLRDLRGPAELPRGSSFCLLQKGSPDQYVEALLSASPFAVTEETLRNNFLK